METAIRSYLMVFIFSAFSVAVLFLSLYWIHLSRLKWSQSTFKIKLKIPQNTWTENNIMHRWIKTFLPYLHEIQPSSKKCVFPNWLGVVPGSCLLPIPSKNSQQLNLITCRLPWFHVAFYPFSCKRLMGYCHNEYASLCYLRRRWHGILKLIP